MWEQGLEAHSRVRFAATESVHLYLQPEVLVAVRLNL